MLSIELQRSLLMSTSLVLLIMTSGLVALKLFYFRGAEFPYPAAGLSACLLGNICYIKLGGSLGNSKLFTLVVMVLGFVLAVVNTGGFGGAPFLLAPILPMTALLWFDKPAGSAVAVLVVVLLAALLAADIYGFLPANPQSIEAKKVGYFFTTATVTAVCTWLAWTLAQTQEHHININRHEAATDHLTDLPNRRAIDDAMLREVGRAKRDQNWFSFAMLDVDFFKRFNDSRGHQAGDECLVKIAELIKASLHRPTDVAGRYGGEEFAIILPDTDPEGAYGLVEAIRKNITELNLADTKGSGEIISVTIGLISIAGSRISSIEDIVREADSALYRGKAGGRNQVVMKTIDAAPIKLANQA